MARERLDGMDQFERKVPRPAGRRSGSKKVPKLRLPHASAREDQFMAGFPSTESREYGEFRQIARSVRGEATIGREMAPIGWKAYSAARNQAQLSRKILPVADHQRINPKPFPPTAPRRGLLPESAPMALSTLNSTLCLLPLYAHFINPLFEPSASTYRAGSPVPTMHATLEEEQGVRIS